MVREKFRKAGNKRQSA